MEVEVISHRFEVLEALETQARAALEACGNQAVSITKQNITSAGRIKDSGLINSITHEVQDDTCIVGSNLDYAVYHEVGTGVFASEGGGRQGWWVYVPGSSGGGSNSGKIYTEAEARQIVAILQSKGIDAHMTQGIKPVHFLKNAIADNIDEYEQIMQQYLSD